MNVDKYPDFEALAEAEAAGVDYRIVLRRDSLAFALVSPHGGGIEPGTSEIADAIAGDDHSFYAFEGLKSSRNSDLHVTSTRFDEPMCLALLDHCGRVVTIHGEQRSDDGEPVFVGGLDEAFGRRLSRSLRSQGFDVRTHPDPDLRGREPENLCNRGTTGAGVQSSSLEACG
jgi:phage replication-related protein YjqB (UPF0714/DUF867 family)